MLSFMDHVRLTDTRPDAKVSRNLENRYVGGIVSNCASLATFPDGGTKREDVRPNLRTKGSARSPKIAFSVDASSLIVAIHGVFYDGQDFESVLRDTDTTIDGSYRIAQYRKGLRPHRRPSRIISRSGEPHGGPPFADDFDLEARLRRRVLFLDIAHRERLANAVPVAARGDPADDAAVAPDRLVADRVGVVRLDREGRQPQLAAGLLLQSRRLTADEIVLAKLDETAEPRLVRTVDRPIFARPRAEALLQPQRRQRPAAELDQTEWFAGGEQECVQRALIFRANPDFVAEFAREADASDQGRNHADVNLPEREEGERRVRDIGGSEPL